MPDFDNAWKEALDLHFEPFMAFFFPAAHGDIDWARGFEMDLPRPLAKLAWKEIYEFEKEKNMPFVTGAELVGHEKGLAEGLAKGRQEGRQEAREDLLAAIEDLLEIKFGQAGLELAPEIRQIADLELLRKTQRAIKQAATPQALRQTWTGP